MIHLVFLLTILMPVHAPPHAIHMGLFGAVKLYLTISWDNRSCII